MDESRDNHTGIHAQYSVEDELTSLKAENRTLLDEYEAVIARANALEVEAEIAHLEFSQVFNAIDDAIWVIDNEKKVLRFNHSLATLLKRKGKSPTVGKKCHELMPSHLCDTEQCPLKKIKKGRKRIEQDVVLKIAKDQTAPFWLTVTPLFGLTNEIIGIVEQYKDITVRKRYEEALENTNHKLTRLASVDGLTQLANRRHFDETFQKEWLRMRRDHLPLSLILCDIDFFKRYNDYYGHQEGDECLKAVAGCIQSTLNRPSDFAARYGGEEFVVILPNTDSNGARHMAETIRKAVAAMKLEHQRSEVAEVVTLSFGTATVVPPVTGNDPKDLFGKADVALYESKASGRNRVTAKTLD